MKGPRAQAALQIFSRMFCLLPEGVVTYVEFGGERKNMQKNSQSMDYPS
jgi:hypothetical protein